MSWIIKINKIYCIIFNIAVVYVYGLWMRNCCFCFIGIRIHDCRRLLSISNISDMLFINFVSQHFFRISYILAEKWNFSFSENLF